jgi:glycosyltransferase involved in cell wall biosynthesis
MYEVAVIVAPYSPVSTSGLSNLAAAKKIESVIRVLSKKAKRLVLVDSSHSDVMFSKTKVTREVVGGIGIIVVTPFRFPIRPVGKLLNFLFPIFSNLRNKYSHKKNILWLYNSYSFEALYFLFSKGVSYSVLEIEDLPFSRRRGILDLKDRLDSLFYNRIKRQADLITCVNSDIAYMINEEFSVDTMLLPTLLSSKVTEIPVKLPFQADKIRLGYFGGLNKEKGGELLIRLIENLPEGYELLITGMGEMSENIQLLASGSEYVNFYGVVEEAELYSLMASVDVLLNPHAPIDVGQGGIFPFKVCEYLAMEKLIISSPLPFISEEVTDAIDLFDGGFDDFLSKIESSKYTYQLKEQCIKNGSLYVRSSFSESAISNKLTAYMEINESYENP